MIKHAWAACVLLGASGMAVAGEGHGKGTAHHFGMMDADGDGKVTAAEHEAGAKTMFGMMDADKDGKVTAAEMDSAHGPMSGAKKGQGHHKGMSAADKIKTVDGNGDGVLTADEHTTGAKKMFGIMDSNHDGSLTKAELTAGHAKMMKHGD